LFLLVVGTAVLLWPAAAPAAGAAAPRLAAARAALGGETRLRAITSLIVTGTTESLNRYYLSRPRDNEQWVQRTLELRVLWPDHFLLIGRLKPGAAAVTEHRQGFAGNVSLTVGFPAVGHYQLEFAKRMLLILLRTDTALPLTLRDSLSAAGELEFTGALGFHGLLTLDAKTSLPLRLVARYQLFDGKGVVLPQTATAVIDVLGRRTIDGISFPERLRFSNERGATLSVESYGQANFSPALTRASFSR
jgi:hypothetical protein